MRKCKKKAILHGIQNPLCGKLNLTSFSYFHTGWLAHIKINDFKDCGNAELAF
jgi:hypothetical protein